MNQKSEYAGGFGALLASGKALIREKALASGSMALLRVNQNKGFDCPGCAWPEGKSHAMDFCENGLKAVAAEVTTKRIGPDFFDKHSVSELAQQSDFWLEQQGRLTEPMVYDAVSDKYKPLPWEKAFDLVGKSLNKLAHPNQAAFYTSGRTSNEAAFLYQLFAREFGTNNLPDCSNMCHESSGVAMMESLGIGKGTVTLEDFEISDCILILGQNPGTNHPRMLTALQAARKRGAEIIAVNPLKETGLLEFIHPKDMVALATQQSSSISSLYLTPIVGGDLALLKGIAKLVLAAESKNPGAVLDHEFIRAHTTGFEAFSKDILETSWETIERESGLTRDTLGQAADIYMRSKKTIACWAMGLTQQRAAVATIQYAVNLLLLKGNIGRPGAGACPVRGHSNVQGDRTMGITEKPSHEFLSKLGKVFSFQPPESHGFDVVETLKAMDEGEIKILIAMGGNFAVATPDRDFTEQALRRCELTVHVSTKLNRSHLVVGKQALIFPCLGRSEADIRSGKKQRVTVEDSMSMVHASIGHKAPASPMLLSEPAIVAGMARATLKRSLTPWDGLSMKYDLIREKIAEVIPGFEGFNAKIDQPGGFYLGNTAGRREWKNIAGKALFKTAELESIILRPGELRLMTIRSHDQYNTTIYGLDDRYRGVLGERRVVFLNAEDMRERGIVSGEMVDLVGKDKVEKVRMAPRFKAIRYDIPKGCAAAYFPETNVLVPVDSVAERSNTPTSKFIPIQVLKVKNS